MPFILVGIILLIYPGYFLNVTDHPLFTPAISFGLLLLLVGNFVMYRMVNFKY